MARVTRRGGIVSACVWDYAENRGPLGPFWTVARRLDSTVEDESELPGAREGDLVQLLVAAGLVDVEETVFSGERSYEIFDEWWEPVTLSVGFGGAYVARLGPERVAELRERCTSVLPHGPFRLTAHAWGARGSPRP
jgi:hypothetical protein